MRRNSGSYVKHSSFFFRASKTWALMGRSQRTKMAKGRFSAMGMKGKIIGAGITTLLVIGGGLGKLYQKRKARKEAKLEKDIQKAIDKANKGMDDEQESLKELVRLMETNEDVRNTVVQFAEEVKTCNQQPDITISQIIKEAFKKAEMQPDEETLNAIDRIFASDEQMNLELAIADP